MGGAGFVFTGENDADIMHNSVSINLNVLEEQREGDRMTEANRPVNNLLRSSTLVLLACIQSTINLTRIIQIVVKNQHIPAAPDSEYGWEKLFSERLYLAYNRNHGIPVRIARYHNIFGPEGTWEGGREKAPSCNLP